MSLKSATNEIFGQLTDVIGQLDNEDYACSLHVLSGNTIGKHVRHILEFYDLLVNSYHSGRLNYDRRERDLLLEISPDEAIRRISRINDAIQHLDLNRPLHLEAELSARPVQIASSYDRELLYNIEHAIHHMALIQIAVCEAFLHVIMPPNFGVAYSTIQHQSR
ncbi:MAG: DinB family protein [Bacteroidetes bacterium]|nr:DinB family protein [Fibrella sp.]